MSCSSEYEDPSSDLTCLSALGNELDLYTISASTNSGSSSRRRSPKQQARVKSLAVDPDRSNKSSSSPEEHILERVRKCLDRGRHPKTPEAEAKTSLIMAAKLMKQHNLKESQVYAKSGTMQDENVQRGDSTVEVWRSAGGDMVAETHARHLMYAMELFFDCAGFYSRRGKTVDYTFYGIPQNTAAAAMAFEMCYNLIAHWALDKIGVSAAYGYRVGVAEGLIELAKEEKTAWQADNGLQVSWNRDRMMRDYFRSRGKKLPRMGRRGAYVKDRVAWSEGKKDSEKINVRARRLK